MQGAAGKPGSTACICSRNIAAQHQQQQQQHRSNNNCKCQQTRLKLRRLLRMSRDRNLLRHDLGSNINADTRDCGPRRYTAAKQPSKRLGSPSPDTADTSKGTRCQGSSIKRSRAELSSHSAGSEYSTVQYSTVQYRTVQMSCHHTRLGPSIVQYSTVQYSTEQYR